MALPLLRLREVNRVRVSGPGLNAAGLLRSPHLLPCVKHRGGIRDEVDKDREEAPPVTARAPAGLAISRPVGAGAAARQTLRLPWLLLVSLPGNVALPTLLLRSGTP